MTATTISLAHAKKGNIYLTQDGREAVYIGHDKKLQRPYMFRVGDAIWTRRKDGKHCDTCNGSVYPFIVGRK